MVVRRGINEASIVPMAAWARETGVDPAVHRVHGRRAFERLAPRRGRPGGGAGRADPGATGRSSRPTRPTAARSPIAGATSTVAASSGSSRRSRQPFCGDCTRARLSAEGKLYTCLFAVDGHDVREAILRGGATDEELAAFIDGRLVAARRPLLGAAVGGDVGLVPAQGRDVRDGRLSGSSARSRPPHRPHRSSTPCPQPRATSWIRSGGAIANLVDNRVDPSTTRPVP